jgi:hypothetical protein
MLITKSPTVISDIIDEMVIVINVESGAYYSLTKSGSELWIKIENSFTEFDQLEMQYIKGLVEEEILSTETSLEHYESIEFSEIGLKFTDMEEMLLGDPIHEVDQKGWPVMKKDQP